MGLQSSSHVPNSTDDAPRKTRVLCVDDHESIRWVLRLLFDAEPDMECAGCIGSCNRLVEDVRTAAADVVLLDATMPGTNPLVAMGQLNAALPRVKTIVYSGHDNKAFVEGVMNAGAWGFVSKNDTPEVLLKAVRTAAAQTA